MDWIRLGNSGEDLAGTGGAILQVTREELAKHCNDNDVWMCIRGNIYNITRYLDFHPGGKEELMKGAGIDSTTLFNQVHPWVNFESILRKCFVGRLTNPVEENVFHPGPSKTDSKLVNNILKESIVKKNDDIKLDWYQQQNFITMVIYMKEFPTKLQLNNEGGEELHTFLNGRCLSWFFTHSVVWPPILTVTENKVEAKFIKEKSMTWPDLPRKLDYDSYETAQHWPMVIKQIQSVNHNVFLISMTNSKRVLNYVPIGYHVPVKATINGISLERNYTVICGLTNSLNHDINLLVKSYSDGMFSSWFTSRKVGEEVLVGNPVGSFSLKNISEVSHIILIAAGSGFTPMIRIMDWALARRSKVMEVKLIFFNKTEKDIIWKSELEKLQSSNKRLKVEHVLSEAESSWKGVNGWITPQLLQGYIPNFSEEDPLKYYICVCGPVSFTQLSERYLQDMGYNSNRYFCFRG